MGCKFGIAFTAAAAAVSCKTTPASSTKDIGVVNTQDATTKVLYSDQNKVYLKVCKPPLAPPLTRDCASDEVPKYLELDYYIFKLPYDVGPYQRNKEGLGLVTKALQDAQNAVAGGNQNAVPTVSRLTPFRLNLEKMMKLRDDLAAQRRDLTYYEYQDEFQKLLAPFGEMAPGVNPLPANNGGAGLHTVMTFVKIPAGTFMMGSPISEVGSRNNEGPIHNVTISRNFEMQATEVTQAQWFSVSGENPSNFTESQHCPGEYKQENGVSLCPNNPVEGVSWDDVQMFIQRLNAKGDGFQYRLPSEAEWEFAARAGTTGLYGISGNLTDFAWYKNNSDGFTHPVARKLANAWGLYDMHGNVLEWTADWYVDKAYTLNDVIDPLGPSSGVRRVHRGGSGLYGSWACRSAFRNAGFPGERFRDLGFRLVRTAK
jgi:formylglycine-generating enzyme required for sulfatase activity